MARKSVLVAVRRAARDYERVAKRQQREYERGALKAEKEYQKQVEREEAAYEVDTFNNDIEVLTSMHKECIPPVDWATVADEARPLAPARSEARTAAAVSARETYSPGFFTKLFGRTNANLERLDAEIQRAQAADQQEFDIAMAEHAKDCEQWDTETKLAKDILAGSLEAFDTAVDYMDPFTELRSHRTWVTITTSPEVPSAVKADLEVAEVDVVPDEVKTLTKTGKVSTRAMPKGRGHEIYQDYVCGALLRVARELFALLPVEAVVVTATTSIFNSATGHDEDVAVVSAAIPRMLAQKLNFDALDPSDAMENFPHRMAFKKTKGFAPVDPMDFSDIPVMVESA